MKEFKHSLSYDCFYDGCVLDPRALNDSLEDVLHWACQSKEAKEVLVELLLPQLEKK